MSRAACSSAPLEWGRHRTLEIDKSGDILDPSQDRLRKGGTGLGLSICKAVLEQLGGQIDFETESGRGARLFFDLPEWRAGDPERRTEATP